MKEILLKGNNGLGVLLLHTLGGNPMQMEPLGKKLHALGYTVYIPLYRNHGSEFIHIFQSDVSDWYQDVEAAIDTMKQMVSKFFVMGMSIGGTFTVKAAQDHNLLGAVVMNGPIIGFDLLEDLKNFSEVQENKVLYETIKKQRFHYFHFVTEIGQISNINKITCPLFVVQGSKDDNRYKTSSELLMQYAKGPKKRINYENSGHIILGDKDRKTVFEDIITFVKDNS